MKPKSQSNEEGMPGPARAREKIEITFVDLFAHELALPSCLGYHAVRILPALRGLKRDSWRGESLYQLSADLKSENFFMFPHGLRYGLRDLMDCGAIKLKPDPRLEPLL